MTHDQLMRLTFAFIVGPAVFVLEHLERKHGHVDLSDLQTLDDDERKAVRDAMPAEFITRLANRLGPAEHNRIAEMLGPGTMAKAHEAVAATLRSIATAKP